MTRIVHPSLDQGAGDHGLRKLWRACRQRCELAHAEVLLLCMLSLRFLLSRNELWICNWIGKCVRIGTRTNLKDVMPAQCLWPRRRRTLHQKLIERILLILLRINPTLRDRPVKIQFTFYFQVREVETRILFQFNSHFFILFLECHWAQEVVGEYAATVQFDSIDISWIDWVVKVLAGEVFRGLLDLQFHYPAPHI